MAQAPELLAQPPVIEPVDVLAAKLPDQQPTDQEPSRTR
jgi:hypothetical protein